jgi:hypothetical protein
VQEQTGEIVDSALVHDSGILNRFPVGGMPRKSPIVCPFQHEDARHVVAVDDELLGCDGQIEEGRRLNRSRTSCRLVLPGRALAPAAIDRSIVILSPSAPGSLMRARIIANRNRRACSPQVTQRESCNRTVGVLLRSAMPP